MIDDDNDVDDGGAIFNLKFLTRLFEAPGFGFDDPRMAEYRTHVYEFSFLSQLISSCLKRFPCPRSNSSSVCVCVCPCVRVRGVCVSVFVCKRTLETTRKKHVS